MSSHTSLDAAAQDRKARLAQLKSLKRKQPSTDDTSEPGEPGSSALVSAEESVPPTITSTYLSGRNYDPEVRGPKLGFDANPAGDAITLEQQAAFLAERTKAEAEAEEKSGQPLDLFKLQPKKPNWDLKRDLDKKLEILNTRTDNAIARLVRERIEAAKKAKETTRTDDEGEEVGMDGNVLVEAMHVREREEEEEARREREVDDMDVS